MVYKVLDACGDDNNFVVSDIPIILTCNCETIWYAYQKSVNVFF